MAEPLRYRAPKGTHDVIAPESTRWVELVARFARRAALAGYGLHVPPLFEHYDVFARVGDSTEIVRKEMYELFDRGEPPERFALRPEGTASVVRAFVQLRPLVPWKVWYVQPSFRYEAPQAGRYRQHHQVGAEVLGSDDPDLDTEVIAFLSQFLADLGLRQVSLHLSSLGDENCRPAYLASLRSFLDGHHDELSQQSQQTLTLNPLRVLDSKRPQDDAVIDAAPKLVDHLCDECATHFARVQGGLHTLGIDAHIQPRLVRGLDYYTRTTFEFAAEALAAAQNGVGGGGRYDGLAAQMGGPPTPGIGFGAGIERILLACDAEAVLPAPDATLDVFVVDVTGGVDAVLLTDELRRAGVRADRGFDRRSMKAQMKSADRSGASLALIVGDDEAAAATVTVRDLRDGQQESVAHDDVVAHPEVALLSMEQS